MKKNGWYRNTMVCPSSPVECTRAAGCHPYITPKRKVVACRHNPRRATSKRKSSPCSKHATATACREHKCVTYTTPKGRSACRSRPRRSRKSPTKKPASAPALDLSHFYEICRHRRRSPSDLFLRASVSTSGATRRFRLRISGEVFQLGQRLGKGANGTVFKGTFGEGANVVPIAIKMNERGSAAEDAAEVKMQADLFCTFREHAFSALRALKERHALTRMAKVPKPYFAAHTPAGRAIGMETLDVTLVTYIANMGDTWASVEALKSCLSQMAGLLHMLQEKMQFVHGDLHGENVMLRLQPQPQVFMIDYGMSSYGANTSRTLTHPRYKNARFNPCLDLLMLLSHVRETLGRTQKDGASRRLASEMCDFVVHPFWAAVRTGDRTAVAKYSAHTVRAYYERVGRRRYAHHLLYEKGQNVTFDRTRPGALIEFLGSLRAFRVPRYDSRGILW